MVKIEVDANYHLVSLQTGTYITLSNDDNTSIVCSDYTYQSNQTWMFESTDRDGVYYIKSSQTGQYVTVASDQIAQGQPLKADFAPFEWQAVDEPNMAIACRFVPTSNKDFYIDLNQANPAPGTLVQLWPKSGYNQVWVLEKIR